jgi:uncharacterized protein with HEPN domain
MRDWAGALSDARDYARRCAEYVTGIDRDAFISDQMRWDAVCFCIVVVGEAFNSVPRILQNRVPHVPWAAVVAMRNRLVHEYWNIDPETVFQVATCEAGHLADQIDILLQQPA